MSSRKPALEGGGRAGEPSRRVVSSETDADGSSERAAAVLERGLLVAHPTETVYGLAGAALDERGYRGLLRLKGGTTPRAFLLLFEDRTRLHSLLGTLPPGGEELARAFWPGPITLLFPPPPDLPAWWSGPDGDVAARVTPHPFCSGLIRRLEAPLLSTSANRAGDPPLTSARAIARAFTHEDVALVVDGGVLAGPASTLLRWTEDAWTVLRHGPVAEQAIRSTLQGASELFA